MAYLGKIEMSNDGDHFIITSYQGSSGYNSLGFDTLKAFGNSELINYLLDTRQSKWYYSPKRRLLYRRRSGNYEGIYSIPCDVVYSSSRNNFVVPEKEDTEVAMNYSAAVTLVHKGVRGIKCVYDSARTGKQEYIFKTLDPSIAVDDYVVVPRVDADKFTVVKVVGVDAVIDIHSHIEYKWIVTKIDPAPYEELLKKEEETVKAIKDAKLKKELREIRDDLFAGDLDTLQALPLYKNGDHPAGPVSASKPEGEVG